MSISSKPRVVRRHKSKKVYTLSTYRKALPFLLRDFEQRCAYSLVHAKTIHEREMHVDHHDPRKKRKSRYENLFPAYGCCNGAKADTWPSKAELAMGCRFLNPCKESDYGVQIFEDNGTNELVGVTPAAKYHIEMLDLNHPSLILQRKERSTLSKILNRPVVSKQQSEGGDVSTVVLVQRILQILSYKIPAIPPPPTS